MEKYQSFSKIPRLSRDIVITEKIDGTNGQIYIEDTCYPLQWVAENLKECEQYILTKVNGFNIYAGSRKRWLDVTSKGDNYGFAKWVQANAEELVKLGEGHHYGEWWGKGIQRGYGMDEKVFSLFNVGRWVEKQKLTQLQLDILDQRPEWEQKLKPNQKVCPACCRVVPILYEGEFDTENIEHVLDNLARTSSECSPGFKNPEGIIIFHTASGKLFKKTIKNDEKPKGE